MVAFGEKPSRKTPTTRGHGRFLVHPYRQNLGPDGTVVALELCSKGREVLQGILTPNPGCLLMPRQFKVGIIGATGRDDYGHGLDRASRIPNALRSSVSRMPAPRGLKAAGKRLGVTRLYADYKGNARARSRESSALGCAADRSRRHVARRRSGLPHLRRSRSRPRSPMPTSWPRPAARPRSSWRWRINFAAIPPIQKTRADLRREVRQARSHDRPAQGRCTAAARNLSFMARTCST